MSHGSPKKTIHLRLGMALAYPLGLAAYFTIAVWLLGTAAVVLGVVGMVGIEVIGLQDPLLADQLWTTFDAYLAIVLTSEAFRYLLLATVASFALVVVTRALLYVVRVTEETYYRLKYRLRS